jgi:hypothetical protein
MYYIIKPLAVTHEDNNIEKGYERNSGIKFRSLAEGHRCDE